MDVLCLNELSVVWTQKQRRRAGEVKMRSTSFVFRKDNRRPVNKGKQMRKVGKQTQADQAIEHRLVYVQSG